MPELWFTDEYRHGKKLLVKKNDDGTVEIRCVLLTADVNFKLTKDESESLIHMLVNG